MPIYPVIFPPKTDRYLSLILIPDSCKFVLALIIPVEYIFPFTDNLDIKLSLLAYPIPILPLFA